MTEALGLKFGVGQFRFVVSGVRVMNPSLQ